MTANSLASGASLHIILVEPEIPQNTGNIARTCAATGAALHLVEPLGFSLADRYLKRAGLDYWNLVEVHTHRDLKTYIEANPDRELYYYSKNANHTFTEIEFEERCGLVFGKETAGLPRELLLRHPDRALRIPMIAEARSLNLSNAVAVAAYEVLRQRQFRCLV